ncbi:MAG: hypothetical protein AB1333_03765 [Patescibacteria group bacterium]
MEWIKETISYIVGIDWKSIFYIVRWIFITLDIILVILFVLVFRKALEHRPKFTAFPGGKKSKKKRAEAKKFDFTPQWKKILTTVEAGGSDASLLAIIEADKLVDTALKNLKFEGEYIAERLERAGKVMDLKTIDDVWRVHRIRNNLVHTPGFQISQSQVNDVLKVYEKFLKELNVL